MIGGKYIAKGRNQKAELILKVIEVTNYHMKRYTLFDTVACLTYYDANFVLKLCLRSLESMMVGKC